MSTSRPVLRTLFAALAIGGGGLHAAPVLACGETPCAQRTDVLPSNGSVDVPTNTELRIGYDGYVEGSAVGLDCDLPLDELRLVPRDGEALMLHAVASADSTAYPRTWFVARPVQPLLPNTTYTLQAKLDGAGSCTCDDDAFYDVTTFTTGAAEISAAPAFAGEVDLEYTEVQRGESSCGPYHGFSLEITPRDAPSTADGTRYQLYVNGKLAAQYLDAKSLRLGVNCIASAESDMRFTSSARVLEVRAVDLAGRESPAHHGVTVTDQCAGDEDPGDTRASGDRGCHVGRTATTTDATLVAMALALLLARVSRVGSSMSRATRRARRETLR